MNRKRENALSFRPATFRRRARERTAVAGTSDKLLTAHPRLPLGREHGARRLLRARCRPGSKCTPSVPRGCVPHKPKPVSGTLQPRRRHRRHGSFMRCAGRSISGKQHHFHFFGPWFVSALEQSRQRLPKIRIRRRWTRFIFQCHTWSTGGLGSAGSVSGRAPCFLRALGPLSDFRSWTDLGTMATNGKRCVTCW